MTDTLVDDFHIVFRGAQDGEHEAVQFVVREFIGPLESFLQRRGIADAESTANTVIERAIRGGDGERITTRRAFRAYLYAIARNEVVNQQRSVARRVPIDLVEDLETAFPQPTQTAPSPEAEVLSGLSVEQLLATVSDEQAEVLELRLIEGQTLQATARILGKSLPAVTSLQHRGVKRLRNAISTVVVVALVLVAARFVGSADAEAPVISDETGVVETVPPETGRSEQSSDVLVPDVRLPSEIGGGTVDDPVFTVEAERRRPLTITPAESLTVIDLPERPEAPTIEAELPPAVGPLVASPDPVVPVSPETVVSVSPERSEPVEEVEEVAPLAEPVVADGAPAGGIEDAETPDSADGVVAEADPAPLDAAGNGADGADGEDTILIQGAKGADGADGADANTPGNVEGVIGAAMDQVAGAFDLVDAVCANLLLPCTPPA